MKSPRYRDRQIFSLLANQLALKTRIIAGCFEAGDCAWLVLQILEALRDSVTQQVRESEHEDTQKKALLVQSMKINRAFDDAISAVKQFEDLQAIYSDGWIPDADLACDAATQLREASQVVDQKIAEVYRPQATTSPVEESKP